MVASYTDATVRFKALAHPVRLQILDMLRSGEVWRPLKETTVTEAA